jgi:hypothetical protein
MAVPKTVPDILHLTVRELGRMLVSGSSTMGTAGYRLRAKILDLISSFQQQMVGNHTPRTGYGPTTQG